MQETALDKFWTGDDYLFLYDTCDEETFEYMKKRMTAIDKSFNAIRRSKGPIIKQIADIKGVPVAVIEKALGFEYLESYLIQKYYDNIIAQLTDAKIPMHKKDAIAGYPVMIPLLVKTCIMGIITFLIASILGLAVFYATRWACPLLAIMVCCIFWPGSVTEVNKPEKQPWVWNGLFMRPFSSWLYNAMTGGGRDDA
jgi:hypothetical protein